MISCGLDVSCASTGIVFLKATEKTKTPETVYAGCIKPKGLTGVDRNMWICSEIMEKLVEYQPGTLVMEDYSLGRNLNAAIALCELGGILRMCLKMDGHSWLGPRAGQLKKFVSGKGDLKKDQITMHVFKNWGFEAANNDIADAYGLAALGLAYRGLLAGLTQKQAEPVGEMKLISN